MTNELVDKIKIELENKSVEEKRTILAEHFMHVHTEYRDQKSINDVTNWFLKNFEKDLKEIGEANAKRKRTT